MHFLCFDSIIDEKYMKTSFLKVEPKKRTKNWCLISETRYTIQDTRYTERRNWLENRSRLFIQIFIIIKYKSLTEVEVAYFVLTFKNLE
jgi:hypothetical protein